MKPEIAKAALQFLMRTRLEGVEVSAFNAVVQELNVASIASRYEDIYASYKSGQVSERQWQEHLKDSGFKEWLSHRVVGGGVDEPACGATMRRGSAVAG